MKKITAFVCLIAGLSVCAQDSLNVTMLFNWDDPSLPANGFFGNQYNEVWGFEQGGVEYAVIGSTMGTHIWDVSDPANAVLADYVPGADGGSHIIHRDYHDYNGYLYAVSDEGTSTLQIMDLSTLPTGVTVVYDSDALIRTCHNIFIDTATARLYACGMVNGSIISHYLSIFDISTPTAPSLLLEYDAIDYYHDITVYNDTAIGHNGFFGMSVIDFSNVSSPNVISTLTTYPYQGYNHSGYTTEDHQWYVLADETHGMQMKMIDMSDPTTPTPVANFWSGVNATYSIPHNPVIKGDYAFVAYYHDGLYIFDISDPLNPVISGYYDTSTMPHDNDYVGAWGVYPFLSSGIVLISDMQNGLFVLDVSDAVGIDDSSAPQNLFTVFPNPFTNELNVHTLASFSEVVRYTLTDISGKTVGQGTLSRDILSVTSLEIDEELNAGIYFLTVGNDRYLQSIKVVKQ